MQRQRSTLNRNARGKEKIEHNRSHSLGAQISRIYRQVPNHMELNAL